MPDHTIYLTDAHSALLARVQAHLGLSTPEDAAKWLVRTRLRRTMRLATGRGRRAFLEAVKKAAP